MWSKRRNAEVGLSICYETGKLLIPAKSVKSRHTSSGCFNFSPEKIKRRIKRKKKKKRRPWPRKYFLLHLLLGLWETSREDPSKRSCSAVDRVVATERSKSSCRSGRGLPRQGTPSSAINHVWGFHAMGPAPVTPPPQLSSCHRCFCGEAASSFLLKSARVKGHTTFSLLLFCKTKSRCERNNEPAHPAAVSVRFPSPCLHS